MMVGKTTFLLGPGSFSELLLLNFAGVSGVVFDFSILRTQEEPGESVVFAKLKSAWMVQICSP